MATSHQDKVTFRLHQVVVVVSLLLGTLNRVQLEEDGSLELEQAQEMALVGRHLVEH